MLLRTLVLNMLKNFLQLRNAYNVSLFHSPVYQLICAFHSFPRMDDVACLCSLYQLCCLWLFQETSGPGLHKEDYRSDAEQEDYSETPRNLLYTIIYGHKNFHLQFQLLRTHSLNALPSIPSTLHRCKKPSNSLCLLSPKIYQECFVLDYSYQHLHAGQTPTVESSAGNLISSIIA